MRLLPLPRHSRVIQSGRMPDPDLHNLEYAFPLPVLPLEAWRPPPPPLLAPGSVAPCTLPPPLTRTVMPLHTSPHPPPRNPTRLRHPEAQTATPRPASGRGR